MVMKFTLTEINKIVTGIIIPDYDLTMSLQGY